jgi:hypothetical protein
MRAPSFDDPNPAELHCDWIVGVQAVSAPQSKHRQESPA